MPTSLTTPTTPKRRTRVIDESRWPLVIATFDGDASDEEHLAWLRERTSQLLRRERHALILDARKCGALPPSQRKIQADWQREHTALAQKYTLGVAFLSASPVMRGILTAVIWLQPIKWPHEVVGTWDQAEQWTLERLRAAGLDAPPASAIRER